MRSGRDDEPVPRMRGGGYLDPDDSEPAEDADRRGAGLGSPNERRRHVHPERRIHRLRKEDRGCMGRRSGRERDRSARKSLCNLPGGRAIQKPGTADTGTWIQMRSGNDDA